MGWPNGYAKSYSYAFTGAASALADFPNLILETNADYADVAHGGQVTHTVVLNGQTVPADLIFTSDSAGSALLSWEIESWNNVTGAIVAWVKFSVTTGTDTVYSWVGKSSVTTYQCTASATWNADYATVFHFPLAVVSTTELEKVESRRGSPPATLPIIDES